ncbi:MAG: PilZ domain-containing protein [Spirochaetes bacterium]|nr:PilZ domain-containing protein [Spirochaetota bacterium]
MDLIPERLGGVPFEGVSVDLSASGARIVTPLPLIAGETVDMSVCFDRTDNQKVRFRNARVVWVKEECDIYIAGVQLRTK